MPYNGPVCVAMVLATSTWAIALGNWLNQSQNALVNYCNRNASSPTTTATLVRSYCSAVGASLVVSSRRLRFLQVKLRRQKKTRDAADEISLMVLIERRNRQVGLGLASFIKRRWPPYAHATPRLYYTPSTGRLSMHAAFKQSARQLHTTLVFV